MNTAIDNLSARIHELRSEREYLHRAGTGAAELDQIQLEIGQLQLSRAVIVAYLRYGLDA